MDGISQKKKILIVEDDFFIKDLYQLEAQKSGYDVITAEDGEEGLAKTKSELPDLVLTDLMIPKLDGISLVKAIKSDQRFLNTPCVIITNLEDSTKNDEAKNAGASDYLLKIKNTPQQVIEALTKLLQR